MKSFLLVGVGILFSATSLLGQVSPLPKQGSGVPRRLPKSLSATNIPSVVNFQGVGTPSKDQLKRFDYNQVQVRWKNGRWEVVAGSVWLKDFGRKERDAREAVRVIRRLRLNQRGTIGSPLPILEYWLSDGKAPQLLSESGFRLQRIDLPSVQAVKIQGLWVVQDKKRTLFNFGLHGDQAKRAADVIRRYGFTHVGFIGHPRPSMIYFVSRTIGLTSGFHSGHPGNSQRPTIPNPTISQGKISPTKETAEIKKTQLPGNFKYFSREQIRRHLLEGTWQLAPPRASASTKILFDSRGLVVRYQDNSWKLCHGNQVLVDFGPDVDQAKRAKEILRQYACNEMHIFGHPEPTFHYFLVNGRPPSGLRFGLRGRRFQWDRLGTTEIDGTWYITESGAPLISVGREEKAAQELLAAMKRHRFDFYTQIGYRPGQSMSLLVRTR